MPEPTPLQAGLYAVENGEPRLLASRCDPCDRVFFPRRQYCGRCSSTTLRDLLLARRGTLFGWSLIDRKPKLAVIDPPYLQAEVAMPEGVHVFTVLENPEAAELRVGMPVELHLADVKSPDGDGRVEAYVFRAVTEGAAA